MERKKLQVEYWRVEFQSHRKRIGKRWRTILAEQFPKDFANDEGRRTLDSVGDGRANLSRTAKVVEALSRVKDIAPPLN